MELTKTVVIRIDLLAEFLTLMACARILAEDPDNRAAREWTLKSLRVLANPTLYNVPEPDAVV